MPAPASAANESFPDGWHSYPALRSPRARQILKRVWPRLSDGFANAGNPDEALSHFDSFLKGLPAGVQLFSLYKGPYLEAYENDGSSAFIVDTASTDRDFADCAATMKEMDLIITSDTVSAHLAGTLGVPVWTVLHWDAFWVWRHAGDSTGWYPGMRLFRQHQPLDWTGVMEDVKAALTAHVKETQ